MFEFSARPKAPPESGAFSLRVRTNLCDESHRLIFTPGTFADSPPYSQVSAANGSETQMRACTINLIVLLAVAISGCKTIGDPKLADEIEAANSFRQAQTQESISKLAAIANPAAGSQLTAEDEVKVTEAYEKTLSSCAADVKVNENRGKRRAVRTVIIATIGALAGGVIAPALIAGGASTVLSTSFAGLSGITNSVQQSAADADLSAASARQNAADLRAKLAAPIERYATAFGNTGLPPDERLAALRVAVIQIRSECLLAK